MRTALSAMAVSLCLSASIAVGADVEFEFGTTLFERPAESQDACRRIEKLATADEDFLRQFVVSRFPGFSTYDSPLYDGLFPMTIEAFKRSHGPRDKEVFGFLIASNH